MVSVGCQQRRMVGDGAWVGRRGCGGRGSFAVLWQNSLSEKFDGVRTILYSTVTICTAQRRCKVTSLWLWTLPCNTSTSGLALGLHVRCPSCPGVVWLCVELWLVIRLERARAASSCFLFNANVTKFAQTSSFKCVYPWPDPRLGASPLVVSAFFAFAAVPFNLCLSSVAGMYSSSNFGHLMSH